MIYPIIAAVVISFMVGILIGKLHERIAWNALIRKGVIPKPSK